MRAVSPRFLRTLRGSHDAVIRAKVCTTFQTGLTPTGTEINVTGGEVVISANATVRSTLNLTTVDTPWPRAEDDLLTPYGQEIYIERGISYGNGQREWVGLGYFRIDTPEQDEVPAGEIQISGQDRMAGIVDGRFLTPRQFHSTLTRGALVNTLIQEVYPSAVIEWDDTGLRDGPIGRTVVAEDDRAQTLTDFVTSLDKVGYFDHRGVYVIKSPPAVTGAPAFTVDAGQDGVMVGMSRSLTREGVYNAVVATGEAGDTNAPARGIVVNGNSHSPTWYYGPFGPVPRFFSSPFLTTTAQCQAAARGILRQYLRLPYQVVLEAVVNAALEPLDVIAVKYPRTARNRSLRTEKHVLDEVRVPLTYSAAQRLQTRLQQAELMETLP